MAVNATPTQGTLSYRARVRVPNPGVVLRGGMLVSVTVRKEFHPGAIVVPRSAVFENGAGANVFTVASLPPASPAPGAPKGGGAPPGPPVKLMQAKMVPVQIGLQTDTQAEIRSANVAPGTTVITTRPDTLRNDSIVAVAGPTAGAHGAQ
jgi:multidrug efflux pump subunit AcrA (membrane-fusion protein)